MKTKIVAVRITEKQKQQIKEQAHEMGLNSSELVRTHIVNLIEYGTLNKQKSR
jgi:antitoxin component of RelBE/YafQ-DinJ toxin-antitoxin module